LRWGDLSTDYLTHGIIVIFGYSQDGSYGIIFKKRVLKNTSSALMLQKDRRGWRHKSHYRCVDSKVLGDLLASEVLGAEVRLEE